MEKQDSFDDIMRAKFAKRELPLDEANWEDIKKMTDAAREKKKRRRIGFIFFIGLICGIIGMLPFIIKPKTENTVAETKVVATPTKTSNDILAPESNAKEVILTKKPEEPVKSSLAENKAAENKKEPNIIKEQLETNKNNDVTTTNASPVKKEKTAPVLPQTKNDETKSKQQITSDKKENNVVKNTDTNPVVAEKEKTAPVVSETKAKEENKKAVTKDESKTENIANNIKKSDKEKEVIAMPNANTLTSTETKQAESITNKEDKTNEPKAVKNNSVAVNKNSTQAKDSVAETPKAIAENINPPKADSINKTNNVATKDTASKKDSTVLKLNPWTLSPVLVYNVGGLYNGGTLTGGIETTRALSKHWNVGAGLYYMYFITPSDHTTARTFTYANYDFGASYNTIKITLDRLHYAMLNIFVEFRINKKNALVAGANLFYLVTTSNTITRTSSSYYSGLPTQEQKTYGYTNELSPYNVAIMGGYRRKIIGGLDIALYINYGLTSMTDKKYITNGYQDGHYHGALYTTSVQLELKYNLFRKVKK